MRQERAAKSIQEYEENLSAIKPGEYQVQVASLYGDEEITTFVFISIKVPPPPLKNH